MAGGRDYSSWGFFGYHEEMFYIIKHHYGGEPFPCGEYGSKFLKKTGTNPFYIKAWGTKGYK